MKPIYKSLLIEAEVLSVSLSLQAQVTSGEDVTTQDVQAENLEGLKVVLISPNVSGAKDLIASGECVIDGANISINLHNLAQGIHRVQVSAIFGTQTCVIYALDLTVPAGALSDTPQEFEDEVIVVSTIGDGDVSGADASVYAKDGDGNAHITKPLNVSGSVSEGNPYGEIVELDVVVLTPEQKAEVEVATGTAYDYCDTNDAIPGGVNVTIYADEECTQKVGSTAKTEYADTSISGDFFNLQEGESIAEGMYYARVERGTIGESSHAEGNGTTADGANSHAEGQETTANGANSHTEGYQTTASGVNSHAEGNGTTADGANSHAEGVDTTAEGESSHTEGYSTTASENSSHAEGYSTTASGNSSHAEGNSTTASGKASHAEGQSTIARGANSHAEGQGTIASSKNQHVSGKFNIEDTDGDYTFIIGNGTGDNARSNAFAIDWNGNLVLFNAGTPVVLTPAKLAQLIA